METYLILALIVLLVILILGNVCIIESHYKVKGNTKLKIVQLSDIHNACFGKDNMRLINKVKNNAPDIICITGDIIDKRRPKEDICLSLLQQLVKIAPVYFIKGNHENTHNKPSFEKKIKDLGIVVLVNQAIQLSSGIRLIGLEDINIASPTNQEKQIEYVKQQLDKLSDNSYYQILMIHQPQHFSTYCEYSIDLILAGHTHGGQVRVPIIGGLFAPGQGILPKYDKGFYQQGNNTMIVSQGLGSSLIPIRVLDNPEIVVIEITK